MLQQAQQSGAGSELPFQPAAVSQTPARAAARKPAIIDADTSDESEEEEEEVRPRACPVLLETLASRIRNLQLRELNLQSHVNIELHASSSRCWAHVCISISTPSDVW